MGYKAWGTDWAPYSHIASRTRFAHPNIVPHHVFRENRAKFYREMVVNGPEQEVQDARYQHWLIENPDVKHPDWEDVLSYCVQTGFISKALLKEVHAEQDFVSETAE